MEPESPERKRAVGCSSSEQPAWGRPDVEDVLAPALGGAMLGAALWDVVGAILGGAFGVGLALLRLRRPPSPATPALQSPGTPDAGPDGRPAGLEGGGEGGARDRLGVIEALLTKGGMLGALLVAIWLIFWLATH